MEIHFRENMSSDRIDVYVIDRDVNGEPSKTYRIQITEEVIQESVLGPIEPSGYIDRRNSKKIFEALRKGLAEAGEIESVDTSKGKIEAMKEHIKDLKELSLTMIKLNI
jgi:hypothetical protein